MRKIAFQSGTLRPTFVGSSEKPPWRQEYHRIETPVSQTVRARGFYRFSTIIQQPNLYPFRWATSHADPWLWGVSCSIHLWKPRRHAPGFDVEPQTTFNPNIDSALIWCLKQLVPSQFLLQLPIFNHVTAFPDESRYVGMIGCIPTGLCFGGFGEIRNSTEDGTCKTNFRKLLDPCYFFWKISCFWYSHLIDLLHVVMGQPLSSCATLFYSAKYLPKYCTLSWHTWWCPAFSSWASPSCLSLHFCVKHIGCASSTSFLNTWPYHLSRLFLRNVVMSSMLASLRHNDVI